jgi:hypothetical protein
MQIPDLTIDQARVENKYGMFTSYTLKGSDAATSGNYSVFFTAPHTLIINRVVASWTTASTSGTLNLEILPSGTAPGGGSSVLSTTIDTSATANTPVTKNKRVDFSSQKVKQGDRVALVDGGTITNLTDLNVTIYFRRFNRGDYEK